MELILSAIKRLYPLMGFMILAVLMLANACSGDADTVVVDFSKTLPAESQEGVSAIDNSLRVAVAAMISPKETFGNYSQLLNHIGNQLNMNVELIQRKTYGEINELLGKGQIDMAFICSGPYAIGKKKNGFELLATPQIKGTHFYESYLIVNEGSSFYKLEDLRGRIFAFTDPDSNTGHLVPRYWLAQMGEKPETFFSKTIYTYSHDNSILAVARGLVDGACVDSLIWDYYNMKDSGITSKTRIIKNSEKYGIPPLVVSESLPPELKERLRQVLFSMHSDPRGQKILKGLMIDRFIAPQDEWYSNIREMAGKVMTLTGDPHAF